MSLGNFGIPNYWMIEFLEAAITSNHMVGHLFKHLQQQLYCLAVLEAQSSQSGSATVPPRALRKSSLDSGGAPCLVTAWLQSSSMVTLPPFLPSLFYL